MYRTALITLTLLLLLTACGKSLTPAPVVTRDAPAPSAPPAMDETATPSATIDQSALAPLPASATPTTKIVMPPASPTEARSPAPPPEIDLKSEIEQITIQSGGRWHIIIKPIDGTPLYTRLPEQRITIASVVKVPLAMLFFATLEKNGVSEADLPDYIQSVGVGGRTFDQLLRAMLVRSEEKATKIITDYIHTSINLPAQQRAWGWEYLDLEARRYTAAGVAQIFEQLYRGQYLSPTAKALVLRYLSEYSSGDNTRIAALTPQLPQGYQIYNKRGSLLTPYVIADAAILETPENDYLIIIFAYNSEPKTTYERLDAAVTKIAQAAWDGIFSETGP